MKKTIRFITSLAISIFITYLFLNSPVFAFSENENSQDYIGIHQLELKQDFETKRTSGQSQGLSESPEIETTPRVQKEVFGYHPYWMGDSYQTYHYDLLTTIAYFAVELNSNGTIGETNDWPNNDLISLAHDNGVRVCLVAQNFNESEINMLLNNETHRQTAINNLLSLVSEANADGINIDFENISNSQRNNLTTFIQDLANEFHSQIAGSQVTIAIPAVDWADAFDIASLAQAADSLVIMGYDYHWSTAQEAGPIAPFANSDLWGNYSITSTVETYLSESGNLNEKLILGLPYYGYDWVVVNHDLPSRTYQAGDSKTYIEIIDDLENYERIWDEYSKAPYYKYNSHQVWYEDAESLAYKYDLVNNSALGGIGIWALGYDGSQPELWQLIDEKFATTPLGEETAPMIVTGAGINGGPHVRVFNTDGQAETLPNKLFVYDKSFKGGVKVAVGDINNDGQDEIITAPGAGESPRIRAFRKNGSALAEIDFMAYAETFNKGVNIAVGDLDGDGILEIITGSDQGGGPQIRTFDNRGNVKFTGGFFAYDEQSRLGVNVAAGDLDNDGVDEIITGLADGQEDQIRIFNAHGEEWANGFAAYGLNVRLQINVATGDVDGDGQDEIITGAGTGGGPHVRVFETDGTLISPKHFFAYDELFRGGVQVTTGDVDGDGQDEIITGAGTGGGPHVRVFEIDGTAIDPHKFFAYDEQFHGGVYVGFGNF